MQSAIELTALESADAGTLAHHQGTRLQRLLTQTYGSNSFYTRKFDEAQIRIEELNLLGDLKTALRQIPFTTKAEFVADQQSSPPWGTARSRPLGEYTRYCQTSSTTSSPLRWVDTNQSWQWLLDCWKTVFRAAHVGPDDRIFFPFSFGPFLGFWTAFEAGCQIGAHCVPGGGMSSQVRLRLIETIGATVICCTPTYALWLSEVAAGNSDLKPLEDGSVHTLIVAGEAGGSIPTTRSRIESGWGARVLDHHGLTETGPISFECRETPGALHINEGEFICEVIDQTTGEPVLDGQRGELVVTNLGRNDSPVVRYRTGDIVVPQSGPCGCGRTWARLEGGILARADDMINIKGVNVYPSAIESVVRRFPEIVEFRSTASRAGSMWNLSLEVEPAPGTTDIATIPSKLSQQLREALGLTIPVYLVAPEGLPRFEMKARRFVVKQ
jgi:phenylacetate-CoA ligase